jgi:hypothetical protein
VNNQRPDGWLYRENDVSVVVMDGRRRALHMYGAPSTHAPLAWQWVEDRLSEVGTLWVTATSVGYPHPRPVWGVWHRELLHLSIGTPSIRRQLLTDPRLTVHLDSGTDVVIIEGQAVPYPQTSDDVIQAYNAKYDWDYDVEQYGQLTEVHPQTLVAWRTAGPAGRDGFRESGKWVFG